MSDEVGKPVSSKMAYLFPGQGSQSVGMGKELYDFSPAARRVFDEVDAALDTPLSRILFEGPEEKLTETVNAQPAILAMSVACLEAMKERIPSWEVAFPHFLAGHSLGEYTALVAGNVLSVSDAARLVRERGRLMQEASERYLGGMAAVIGLDEVTLEEICRETGAQISNINSQEQIVLSGDDISLAYALDLASSRGAKKVIRLQVSGAFHSPLMAPAQQEMVRAIETMSFKDPRVPIIANSTGSPMATAREIREELSRQLCQCVQWKRSMEYMLRVGVSSFVEIGPGKVLSGLVKRISTNAQVTNINDVLAKAFAS